MSSSLLLAIFSFIARTLGLITAPLLASKFGASAELDAYFAAFRIPDLIFNLLVIGTVTVAFIPLIKPLIDEKKLNRAYNFAAGVFNLMAVSLGAILIVLYFLVPYLVPIFTEGFDAATLELTIRLTRIMLLSPLFFALSAVLGSVCNAHHRFLPYALAPVLYKLGIILGIVFLVPLYGVMGVAYGVIGGAVMHFLVNIPTLVKLNWQWRPVFFVESEKLMAILKLSFPRLISIGATQINLFVDTFLATGIMAGSLTIFNFADAVGNMPVGVIGLSMAVAAYPVLSTLAHRKDLDKLHEIISEKILNIVFLMLPITIGTIFLSENIIRALFDYGKFEAAYIPVAALVLVSFAISFVPQSLIPLLARSFYAHQKIAAPVVAAVCTLIVNACLAIIFVKVLDWDVWALGLAYSLAAFTNAGVLLGSFWYKFGHFWVGDFWLKLLKVVVLNSLLLLGLSWTKDFFLDINVFIRLIGFGSVFGILYFGIAEILGMGRLWRR